MEHGSRRALGSPGLTVLGEEFDSVSGDAGSSGAGTDTLLFDGNRAPDNTFGVINFDAPGVYDIRLVYWEATGGGEVELFSAAGAFTSFAGNGFELISVDNAATRLVSIPEPTSIGLIALGALGLLGNRRRRA